ncbi:hypothetical protein O6H91_07G078200 [Diphasiastrum complanatum]|uniref:Uncharacterized protein n=2 Tax=Diphasiastrum complanatum TaxID=34168 RepID=A0ACC2D764_DIPCM|nr:hypothetical protein O6H91_07G078200 [Diphasiastrum complanatum]KAJ7550013.1 hypothetical protein O6H91_07G078200 [Diphasiastrum complanatum]
MAIKAAWNAGLHGLNSDRCAKMIQGKAKAKGVHPPAGTLRASPVSDPVSDQRQKQGWVSNGSQKSGKDEVKQVSFKTCAKERLALREHRVALEQDVRQLRQKLTREVNMHKVLERALQRPIGFLPRLPSYLPPQTQELLAEVAVLEEEVVHLQDRVFSLQEELEVESQYNAEFVQQIRLSSCSQSTCNKNPPVYQREQQNPADSLKVKKDVIVAKLLNSVQEPLTVTSSKFDSDLQVRVPGEAPVSDRYPSKQNVAVSPRPVAKYRQPSTSPRIQSTFSPNRPIVSKSKHASSANRASPTKEAEPGKQNQHQSVGSFSSNGLHVSKSKTKNLNPPAKDTVKHNESTLCPTPCGTLNLEMDVKLVQKPEPNKLSEEMIKCLSSIYCMMTRPYLMSEYDTSSSLSRSTFSSFNSQSYGSKSSISMKTGSEISFECDRADPYGVCGACPRDIGPYKQFQNITAKSFDYSRIQDSAILLRRLRFMVDTLGTVNLQGMSHQQKLAFWINIYNVCMMHGCLEYGIPGSPHQVMALMHKAVLNVGGYLVNALAIEHFILRLPSHSKHAFANIIGNENASIQSALGLEWPEPLVSFALSCGSQSSPAVRVYTASKIKSELETAKKQYLRAAIGITNKNKVLIPKLLDGNSCHFAKDKESLMDWICQQIPIALQKAVQECILKAKGVLSRALEVMPYNFSFRYLLVTL